MINFSLNKKTLFLLSVLSGALIVVGLFGYSKITREHLDTRRLSGDLFVSPQISLKQLQLVDREGFNTIIDFRPDGEAPDQPSSHDMLIELKRRNIQFVYIPVPHGEIPTEAVSTLSAALKSSPKPILMYCRSGKRAARTWSLAEASNPVGATEAEILQAVKNSGQSADDLQEAIHQRITNRNIVVEVTQ